LTSWQLEQRKFVRHSSLARAFGDALALRQIRGIVAFDSFRPRKCNLSALAGEACFQLGDGGHLRQDELAHRAAHFSASVRPSVSVIPSSSLLIVSFT
jgi:hypothetical protein